MLLLSAVTWTCPLHTDLVLCFSPMFALSLFLKVDVFWLVLHLVRLALELSRWEPQ